MSGKSRRVQKGVLIVFLLLAPLARAGYKARPWSISPPETYPSRLTSEGVTIAVEPLFSDTLAAKVFDKNDMVTRGIMPLAIIIFNDNDFPVMVDGESIELLNGDDHVRTLTPDEVVRRLFSKEKKNVWIPQPVPRLPIQDKSNIEALEDLEHKFLEKKIVEPHKKGGGFLFLHLPESKDIRGYLSRSRIYLREIYRHDTGANMIFFEVDLKPAIDATP